MPITSRWILGAESGRVMLGRIADGRLTLEQIHRFSNGPVQEQGTLRWDFPRLMAEIKTGIRKAAKTADGTVRGIGVDTWGVDFGLLGADGKLLENPYHYRDSRTNGMMDKAFALMPKRRVYENTGIQFMQLNSLYQLLAMRLANSDVLAKTEPAAVHGRPDLVLPLRQGLRRVHAGEHVSDDGHEDRPVVQADLR